jgi:hypothetical protein
MEYEIVDMFHAFNLALQEANCHILSSDTTEVRLNSTSLGPYQLLRIFVAAAMLPLDLPHR